MELAAIMVRTAWLTAVLMLGLWLLSLWRRDASIVDIFWGLGFVAIAWVSAWAAPAVGPRPWVVVGLTTVWGLRLAGYLAWRKWGEGEDRRYRAIRDRWGKHFWIASLLVVFALQGAILWIVSLPLQASAVATGSFRWPDAVGIALFATGFLFEAIGDWQLAQFRADPANRGRAFDRGLWRYTRHPNYFGDFLVWWGIYLFAAGGGWTIISPLLMSWLLLRVSGVRLLERSLAADKPGYASYMRRTSSFFPWPPQP